MSAVQHFAAQAFGGVAGHQPATRRVKPSAPRRGTIRGGPAPEPEDHRTRGPRPAPPAPAPRRGARRVRRSPAPRGAPARSTAAARHPRRRRSLHATLASNGAACSTRSQKACSVWIFNPPGVSTARANSFRAKSSSCFSCGRGAPVAAMASARASSSSAGPFRQGLEHALGHIGRRRLGEGEAQDAPRRAAREQQPDDPLRQHMGLARTGIGGHPGGIARVGRQRLPRPGVSGICSGRGSCLVSAALAARSRPFARARQMVVSIVAQRRIAGTAAPDSPASGCGNRSASGRVRQNARRPVRGTACPWRRAHARLASPPPTGT